MADNVMDYGWNEDDTYDVYVPLTSEGGQGFYVEVHNAPSLMAGVLALTEVLNESGIPFTVSPHLEREINPPDDDYETVLCRCGNTVTLEDAVVNTCGFCRQEYNGVGQALAGREVWGYETGESEADIIGLHRGEDW